VPHLLPAYTYLPSAQPGSGYFPPGLFVPLLPGILFLFFSRYFFSCLLRPQRASGNEQNPTPTSPIRPPVCKKNPIPPAAAGRSGVSIFSLHGFCPSRCLNATSGWGAGAGRPPCRGRAWDGAAPCPRGRLPAVPSGGVKGGLHPPCQPRGHLRVTRVCWLNGSIRVLVQTRVRCGIRSWGNGKPPGVCGRVRCDDQAVQ